tara:strand:- start:4892 stop:6469 length:1578 start_codon:yes stop_codon:yes gene_type:complete
MANENRIPKGPSNSTGMGATPGTQLTAMQNVRAGNLNPNMPAGPQLERQAASDFQKSLMTPPAPPRPQPRPQARQAPAVRQTPVVSQAMPMDPGRGYNVFSGMDADQITSMNQKMGMSNMTALPSLVPVTSAMPAVDPATSGFGLTPGRPMQMYLMDTQYEDPSGGQHELNASTNTVVVTGGDSPGFYTFDEYADEFGNDPDNYFVSDTIPTVKQQDAEAAAGEDKPLDEQAVDLIYEEDTGFDPEKTEELKSEIDTEYDSAKGYIEQAKSNLDQEYAYKLDGVLAGLDRQAAMMGTFGSGAHSASINNAISGALAQMADEYASLDKSMSDIEVQYAQDLKAIGLGDLAAAETDWQQNFVNLMQAAGFDEAEIQTNLQNAQMIDQNLVSSAAAYIEAVGKGTAAGNALTQALANATGSLYSTAYGSAEEQLAAVESVNAVIAMIGEIAAVESGQKSPEEAMSAVDGILNSMDPTSKEDNYFYDLIVSAIPGVGPATQAAGWVYDLGTDAYDFVTGISSTIGDWFS